MSETPAADVLTPAQSRVVELMFAGLAYDDIAKVCGISPWTARRHVDDAAERLPITFFPHLKGSYNTRSRLMLWWAYTHAGLPSTASKSA